MIKNIIKVTTMVLLTTMAFAISPPPGDIGDRVWCDLNENGIQDIGEPGVSGVQVELWRINPCSATDEKVRVNHVGESLYPNGEYLETDVNGNYLFKNVPPFTFFRDENRLCPFEYYVLFRLTNPAHQFTIPNIGADDVDSDAQLEAVTHTVVIPFMDYSSSLNNLTLDAGILCNSDVGTGTIGYWKTHPNAWPVNSIEIGGVVYDKSNAIKLMKRPTAKNKWLNMFEQLVAAKLNVLNGCNSYCISTVISAADEWMSNVPNTVSANSIYWELGSVLHGQLDQYNNGLLCAPHRE